MTSSVTDQLFIIDFHFHSYHTGQKLPVPISVRLSRLQELAKVSPRSCIGRLTPELSWGARTELVPDNTSHYLEQVMENITYYSSKFLQGLTLDLS